MSIELSPSQERRLHSILDRGLDTLHESVENISRSTPGKFNWSPTLEGSYRDTSQKFSGSPNQTEKSQIINSELKSLQDKLATLEAKLSKNPKSSNKNSRQRIKSPANHYKCSSENSPRAPVILPKRNISRERLKAIENSEKQITKMERVITPSPARYKSTLRKAEKTEKTRNISLKEKKNDNKLKKENELLKKEISKMDELKITIVKLQEENNKLVVSFERSENIRKKQKELINHLKNELKAYSDENLSDSVNNKPKNHKIR